MTTVTIITGRNGSGRALIGSAIAKSLDKHALLVTGKGTTLLIGGLYPINEPPTNIQDVILVMGSEHLEDWAAPFIEKYGEPLFRIHATRLSAL